MDHSDPSPFCDRPAAYTFALRFTPAEWRHLLADSAFLRDPDNSYLPRRLMGVPVQIVPDHWAGA
jgi:hypothetical protein